MKKLVLCFCCFLIILSFSACGQSVKDDVVDNLSDIRYGIFVGQNTEINVSLMCGMRENPYIYDGVSSKKCEFGIITVNIKTKVRPESIPFVLKVDEGEIKGTLEVNPYDHSYMVDIEKIIDTSSAVYISLENLTDTMSLVPESNSWAVDYKMALDIAIAELEDVFPNFYEKRKFCAECYLKIIFDSSSLSSPYYWYFGIVGQGGSDANVIIDPKTSIVVTKTV